MIQRVTCLWESGGVQIQSFFVGKRTFDRIRRGRLLHILLLCVSVGIFNDSLKTCEASHEDQQYRCVVYGDRLLYTIGIRQDDIPPLLADNAPLAVGMAIVEQYPHAVIREVEQESRKGRPVWEVELSTKDGQDLEVLLSESGVILEVSQGPSLIGGDLMFGIGTFWEQSPYKGVGYELKPIPIIEYHKGPLQIATEDGIFASYSLLNTDTLTCGPLVALEIGDGFEDDESDALKGMEAPEMTTLCGGLFCVFEHPFVNIELTFLNEILGEHTGQQVALSLEREWEFGVIGIEPSVTVQFQSARWTDYYYGVSRAEQRAGRPQYTPGSAINVSAGLMAQYELTSHMALIGMAECTKLDHCIEKSPIVEKDLIVGLFTGIMYGF